MRYPAAHTEPAPPPSPRRPPVLELFLLFLVWLVVLFRWMFWGGDGWS